MGERNERPPNAPDEDNQRPALIFVVDDEAPVRRLLTWAMSGMGWSVHTVADAESALRELPQVQPDVLLVDVRLPGMDGIEFARAVRDEPAMADLPLVLMSAYERPHQELADAFIRKPFDIDYLTTFVGSLVERRRT